MNEGTRVVGNGRKESYGGRSSKSHLCDSLKIVLSRERGLMGQGQLDCQYCLPGLTPGIKVSQAFEILFSAFSSLISTAVKKGGVALKKRKTHSDQKQYREGKELFTIHF